MRFVIFFSDYLFLRVQVTIKINLEMGVLMSTVLVCMPILIILAVAIYFTKGNINL